MSHPHDVTTPHPSDDDLALLALGEPLPQVREHVQACSACTDELAALESTVSAVRGADLSALPPPPPRVWARVCEELGLPEQPPQQPAGSVAVADLGARRRWRARVLAAGGALTAAAAGLALVLTLGGSDPAAGSAALVALGDVEARGSVQLASEQSSLLVDTEGLPPPDGVYEVWLLDLDNDRIVTLGTLDEAGRAWLTVPPDVVLGEFPVVDVSLEPDDGDPTHSGNSVLRGEVPA